MATRRCRSRSHLAHMGQVRQRRVCQDRRPVAHHTYVVRLAALDGKLIGLYEHPAEAEHPAVDGVIEVRGKALRIVDFVREATADRSTLAVRPAFVL